MKARRKKTRTPRVVKDDATILVEAARTYGRALKRQHNASAALHRALSQGKEAKRLDRTHGAACDALGAAEHALLVCAAVVGGWSRKSAETSV